MSRSRHHGHHDEDRHDTVPPGVGNRRGTLFDPVSAHGFVAGGAPISSIYRGRAYYFENRENREAFEAQPDKYLAGSGATGEPVGGEREYEQRPRHHHGC
jgi:YHS domain-containing protein